MKLLDNALGRSCRCLAIDRLGAIPSPAIDTTVLLNERDILRQRVNVASKPPSAEGASAAGAAVPAVAPKSRLPKSFRSLVACSRWRFRRNSRRRLFGKGAGGHLILFRLSVGGKAVCSVYLPARGDICMEV